MFPETFKPQRQIQSNVCSICGKKGYVGLHLRNSEGCRWQYCLLLGMADNSEVPKIMSERTKKSRPRQPSRITDQRRDERVRNNLIDFDGLQKFSMETSVPKWVYTCFQCHRVGAKRNMESVQKTEHTRFVTKTFARESLFWRCKNFKRDKINEYEKPVPWIQMTKIHVAGRVVSVPKMTGPSSPTLGNNANASHFLVPSSLSNSNLIKGVAEPQLRPDIIHRIQAVPGWLDLKRLPVDVFEHQTKKILQCTIPSGLRSGKILDKNKKQISVSEPYINTSRVKGTEDYYNFLQNDLKFCIVQEGSVFLKLTAELPKETDCALATAIMQLNENQIEVKAQVNADGTTDTQYLVHPHSNESYECKEDCSVLQDIHDFADEKGYSTAMLSSGPFITSAASCIRSRSSQLTTLIIKNMKASRYFSSMQFPNDRPNAEQFVYLWLESLDEVNKKIAAKESLSAEDKTALIELIDKNVTASLDEAHLEVILGSPSKAKETAKLAKENQFNLSGNLEVLSNITMVKERPTPPEGVEWSLADVMTMIDMFKKLEESFVKQIDDIEDEHFKSESAKTLDHLFEDLRNHEEFSLVRDGNYFELKLPYQQTFKLLADKILLDLIYIKDVSELSAVYHRAISITAESKLEIVLKRPQLRERHTQQYNPIILLGAKAKTRIDLMVTEKDSVTRDLVCAQNETPEQLEEFSADFCEIPIEKALWLMDPNKKLYERDSKPLYVDVKHQRIHKFKEAVISNPIKNYISVVDGKEYELIKDIYDMYLQRIGYNKLTYKQVLVRYGIVEETNEENVHGSLEAQFGAVGGDLIERDFVITCSDNGDDNLLLPEELLTSRGDRLILNKRDRVVTHKVPEIDSPEHMFLNVLLYHPHTSEDEVRVGQKAIEDLYYRKDRHPVIDGEGRALTKIETVRSKLHPKLNSDLWSVFHEL